MMHCYRKYRKTVIAIFGMTMLTKKLLNFVSGFS
ncbi:hypothetical protein MAMMFC1_04235 [Methylomusa anaerophila]|uniref:Uncharacterized protein n=1 Tax=Methylomusa anaerophila TaxID=1930071 RepID=A0A348AR20_9FIRM|nr:hypothetical protein MAMMFC1_04235 [Methylomusa anaerophila]